MPKKGQRGGGGGGEDAALPPCTHVHARHILCEKQSKLLQAKAALDSGRPFADVAREFSEDKARHGGDLGWGTRGTWAGPFEQVVFNLPVGRISEPFRTQHGWHIAMVEGRR